MYLEITSIVCFNALARTHLLQLNTSQRPFFSLTTLSSNRRSSSAGYCTGKCIHTQTLPTVCISFSLVPRSLSQFPLFSLPTFPSLFSLSLPLLLITISSLFPSPPFPLFLRLIFLSFLFPYPCFSSPHSRPFPSGLTPTFSSPLILPPPSLLHQIGFLLQAAKIDSVDSHHQSTRQSPHRTQVSQDYSCGSCDQSFIAHHCYVLLLPGPPLPPSYCFSFYPSLPFPPPLPPSPFPPSPSPLSLH